MKTFLVLAILVFGTLHAIIAQASISINAGLNFTNTNYHLVNNFNNQDSSGFRSYHLLPNLGMDINFELAKRISLTTGIGISIMGSRKYTSSLGSNFPENLKLNYLRFPIQANYQLMDNAKIVFGYSLNYCYRKNYNFLAQHSNEVQSFNIFNKVQHGVHLGVGINFQNIDFVLKYYKGLNNIWDTKDFYQNYRAFLELSGFQFTIGYLIKN